MKTLECKNFKPHFVPQCGTSRGEGRWNKNMIDDTTIVNDGDENGDGDDNGDKEEEKDEEEKSE